MTKLKSTERLLGRQVWCVVCVEKRPPKIRKSDFFVLVRKGHYDLLPDGSEIDNRVIGVCKDCLKSKSEFQRNNVEPVNLDHKHLVYRNI